MHLCTDPRFQDDWRRIRIAITNGGAPSAYHNNPDFYQFLAVSAAGDTIRARHLAHRTTLLGDVDRLTIPSGARFEFPVDLACLFPLYDTKTSATPFCSSALDLTEGGRYTIVVQYRVPNLGAQDLLPRQLDAQIAIEVDVR